jgi:hypothetical protein
VRGIIPYVPPSDFPPDVAFQTEALIAATINIDVMLDGERIEETPETAWATANQSFSDWLDGELRDAQQKRNSIDVFLLNDLSKEIAQEALVAGANPEQLSQWLRSRWGSSISELPATGLFRELTHERHLNVGTTWRRNDLTDMMYLSCAAGYADVVVCERHMRTALNQGLRRLKRSTQVFQRLSDALDPIARSLTARSGMAT